MQLHYKYLKCVINLLYTVCYLSNLFMALCYLLKLVMAQHKHLSLCYLRTFAAALC